VGLSIDKDKYVTGPSGTMLRFSATMSLTKEHWWTKDGCLATRGLDGKLVVLPPVQYFWVGGKRVKYRNDRWSELLATDVAAMIEKNWGSEIVLKPGATLETYMDAPGPPLRKPSWADPTVQLSEVGDE